MSSQKSLDHVKDHTKIHADDIASDALGKFSLVLGLDQETEHGNVTSDEEIRTTPLFSWEVRQKHIGLIQPTNGTENPAQTQADEGLQQFGVLGHEVIQSKTSHGCKPFPLFLNVDAPWSAFICGSQGSGKSYTVSCMIENCLLRDDRIGQLEHPPSGLLFHYDPHSIDTSEAATLASHIPVTVLVSPSNFWQRQKLYHSISDKINVLPLAFKDKHLNVQRIQRLMAFSDAEGNVPLYMEVIMRILRKMAVQGRGSTGLDFAEFLKRLDDESNFAVGQKGPMNLRLQLLSSFMQNNYSYKKDFSLSARSKNKDPFESNAGQLTIVDLSDPLVDPAGACSLFDMCLGLFLENDNPGGKLVILDEAHKFLTGGDASNVFTTSILQLIREQRHKGARIIVSTQEPTVSSSLLDLCSITVVHRFTSPAWLAILRQHLAGASAKSIELMQDIINLGVGESLLFSPSSLIAVSDGAACRMGNHFIKFKTRRRVTNDGGRSVISKANDTILAPEHVQ